MRFIILAPILCLLAVVAAYPIQQIRSREVYPLTSLQAKEPAAGLTPREVTQKIYRRGNSHSDHYSHSDLMVAWNYQPGSTESSPGSDKAKELAKRRMVKFIEASIPNIDNPTGQVDNIRITWAPSQFLVSLIDQFIFITLSVWSLIHLRASGSVWEVAILRCGLLAHRLMFIGRQTLDSWQTMWGPGFRYHCQIKEQRIIYLLEIHNYTTESTTTERLSEKCSRSYWTSKKGITMLLKVWVRGNKSEDACSL